MAEGNSFLPRIQSVFYAVFDVRQGPKIVYQVPESLIIVPPNNPTQDSSIPQLHLLSAGGPGAAGATSDPTSPRKRSVSANRTLFNFDDISKYVIPPSPLCGKLVICSTRDHRVIGFPVELRGNYPRNYFRYNICFVFHRSADLSCYEPVVRKLSRVLTACEGESAFLSNPETSPAVHAILEQLYEDLNSYSETAIQIDRFNSIQLKILPFYPNPPPVHDWQVPVALIDLTSRIQPNWDLTMIKVCQNIDGVSHVSKVAYVAECNLELARQAIAHLLHYQVLIMIDIFQYSNMYTLRKSMQWLADEPHVMEECGPYVTKPGWPTPDWPRLLHLYSRLKPGKPVIDWIQEYDVETLGIDVRRFTSFGVIKGFLRRVHRWPILLPPGNSPLGSLERRSNNMAIRQRRMSSSAATPIAQQDPVDDNTRMYARGRPSKAPEVSSTRQASAADRKSSAAENALESLQSRHQTDRTWSMKSDTSQSSSAQNSSTQDKRLNSTQVQSSRTISRHPQGHPAASTSSLKMPAEPSNFVSTSDSRPTLSRSPSAQATSSVEATASPMTSSLSNLVYPPELAGLLDGEHHTDEIAARFEVGWPTLEKWLVGIGGGTGGGDYGRVVIIYR